MSMIVEENDAKSNSDSVVETKYVDEDGRPNVALLQDRMPRWLQAPAPVVWLTMALGVLFLYVNLLPLWHTDLWGHLAYARWIVQHHALPTVEPLMPLAQGMPFVDIPWLSQLAAYGMFEQFGVTGLQFLNALCIVAVAGLLAYSVYGRTHNLGAALLTLVAFYWGTYQQLLVVRPQLAGMVCFALVFTMATSSRWRNWYTWAIPATFVVWANTHGSFIVGLGLLGTLAAGRAIDIFLRTGKLKFVFAERGLRGLILAAELSAAAVLLNPYGLAVYPEVFAVSGNKNLEALIEWDPLTLRMKQGQAAACIALLLVAMYRWSPRRVTAREVLLLCGLGASMLWHSRMITWWVPVAAYYLGVHTAAVWQKRRRTPATQPAGSGLWTVVLLGLVWICFAYTPFGYVVLHGRPQDPKEVAKKFRGSVSPLTPIDISSYLTRNPPQGLVFNTYEWGDYLLWAGPKDLQVFVNSHAHLVPAEVWKDYFIIANTATGWEAKLDAYGVNAVVVDEQTRGDLIKSLEKLDTWEKKFSDNKGAVFFRKKPI